MLLVSLDVWCSEDPERSGRLCVRLTLGVLWRAVLVGVFKYAYKTAVVELVQFESLLDKGKQSQSANTHIYRVVATARISLGVYCSLPHVEKHNDQSRRNRS